MKKFRFRYDSILKMREEAEERIKNDLARLLAKKHALVEKQAQLITQETTYGDYIEKILAKGGSDLPLKSFESGKQYYREKKMHLNHLISQADREIERTQQKLAEAMQAKKIMEKLKEKAFRQYVDAYNKADIKLIEEIINYSGNHMNGDQDG